MSKTQCSIGGAVLVSFLPFCHDGKLLTQNLIKPLHATCIVDTYFRHTRPVIDIR